MRITHNASLHGQDADRLANAYKIIAAIGSTGCTAMRKYPESLEKSIETILVSIERIIESNTAAATNKEQRP